MINLIIPALLLGANTLAQSPGTFTMNVTTHSTGAPGSGCIILAQIATLSAPNTITAMKPICPPTAPNPSTQGGEVIPWPLSADGDGAASDIAIYGNLPGGEGDTWKPGCVMMVTQRQVSYLLGRNLEWISDTGQVLDMTGGGYLLDTENNYARMICQSNHPYMAGDLNLPSPNIYKPDDSKWWTALTVPGLGEGAWPSPPPPSSDATQAGGSETSSVYSEGHSPTTSFRFIDTATAETSPSEVTGDPTSIQESSLVISAQPSEVASSASEVSSEIPSITTAILTGIESQQSDLPESSSVSSFNVSTAVTEAQASPTDVPALSSIIDAASTSDPVSSSISDVVAVSSNNTNVPQQASPAATTGVPTTIPLNASDAPAPVTSNGTNSSVTTEDTTMVFSQASPTPINGVTTAEPIPIISTAGELTSNIVADPTILNAPSTVPVPTSSPDAGTPVPSAGDQNTSSTPNFEAGQTEVAAPTRQVPNQIPISAVSSLATSSPSSSNISTIQSTLAAESTASPIKVPVIDTTSPMVHTSTPDVESPAFTAIVGEPKVTTSTPDQEGAGGQETSVGAPSQVSQADSSAGPVITLATVAKGRTTAGVTEGANTAVGDPTGDTTGDSVLASSYRSNSSSSSSSSSSWSSSASEELIESAPVVTPALPTSILPSKESNESSLVSGVTAIPVPSDGSVLASTGGYSTLPASTLDPSASSPESPPIPEPTPAVIADKGVVVEPKKSVLRLTTTIYANLTQSTTTPVSSISPMCCSDVLSVSERDLTTITVVSTTTCIPCPSSTGMTAQSSAQITAAVETTGAGSLEAGSALAHTDLPLGDQASAVTSDASVVELSAQMVPSDGMSTIDSGTTAQPGATDPTENASDATLVPASSSPTSDIENRANPTSPPASSPPVVEASPPPATEASPLPAPESSPPPAAEAAPSPDPEASPPPAPEAPPAPTATLDVPTFETTDPFRELGFFPFSASLRLKQRQRGRGGPGGQGGQGGQGGNWGGGGENNQGGWTGGRPAQAAPADTAAAAAAANVEPAAASAAYVAPAAIAAVTEPAAASAADVTSEPAQPAGVTDYESMYDPDQASVQDGSPANAYGSVWSSVVPKTGNVASGTDASTIDRETLASPTSTIPSITSSETPSTAAISSLAPTFRVTSSSDSSSIGFSNAANGTEDTSAEDAAEDGEVDETNGNDDEDDIGLNGDPTITIDDGSTGSESSQATSISDQVTSLWSSVMAGPSSEVDSSRISTSDQSSKSTGASDETSGRESPTALQPSAPSPATSMVSSTVVSPSEQVTTTALVASAGSESSLLSTQVMSQIESTGQTSLRSSSPSNQVSGMESSSLTSRSSATSSSSSRTSQYTASPVSMANTVPVSSIPTSLETRRPTTVPISSSTPSVVMTSERSTLSSLSQVISSQMSLSKADTSEGKTSEVKTSDVKTTEVQVTDAQTLQEPPPPSTSPRSTAQTTSSKTTSSPGLTTQQPSSPSPTEQSSVQPTTTPYISAFMPTSQPPPSSSPGLSSFQPTTSPIVSSQVTIQQSPSSSPEQSSFQPTTSPVVSPQVTTPQTPSSSPEQSTVEPTTTPPTSFQEPTTEQAPSPSSEQSTAEPTTFQEQTTDQPWSTEQPSPESTFEPSSQQSSFEPPPPSSSEDAPPESPTAAPFEEPSSSPVFTDAGVTIGQFLTSLLSNSNDPPADAGSGGGDDVTTIGQFTPTGDIPGLAQATQTLALVQRRGEVEGVRPTPAPVAPHRRRSRLRRRVDRM